MVLSSGMDGSAKLFHSEVSGISTVRLQKSRDKAPKKPGRVVDHGNDARIIEPRRTDHPQYANYFLLGVLERRHDQRRTRQREQLVLGADEDAHAFAALGKAKKLHQVGLGIEILEQEPHSLKVLHGFDVFEQMGAAANDEAPMVGA